MTYFKGKNYLFFLVLIAFFCAAQLIYSAEVDETFSKAAFHAADQNKDGYVDEAEYSADIIDAFVDLDKNSNKKIEKNELIEPDINDFKETDSNKDNVLTLDEIMQGKMDDYKSIDKNKDGLLSVEETILYDKAQ